MCNGRDLRGLPEPRRAEEHSASSVFTYVSMMLLMMGLDCRSVPAPEYVPEGQFAGEALDVRFLWRDATK